MFNLSYMNLGLPSPSDSPHSKILTLFENTPMAFAVPREQRTCPLRSQTCPQCSPRRTRGRATKHYSVVRRLIQLLLCGQAGTG